MPRPSVDQPFSLPDWARVFVPETRGTIKSAVEDFHVTEIPGFELDGEGEHVFLFVEKRGLNTLELVNLIARQLCVKPAKMGYAGLKDRHAITRQWLSVWHPAPLDLDKIASEKISVIKSARHHCKLKRGSHRANHFQITLTQLQQTDDLETAIERVSRCGVPNYFGLQRFGRQGKNVERAAAMFSGELKVDRNQRSLYLSSARSFLFNQVLSERVSAANWDCALQGEVMMLAGSQSFFQTQAGDETLQKRLAEFDIHPSAPLWGKGELKSTAASEALENRVLADYSALKTGLESYGLRQQRRATRLIAEGLESEWLAENKLKLAFSLNRGSFATVVLRELLNYEEQQ